jgi:1-acyl-sn-glycerol-3-phosphate acyltransferase
LIFWTRFINKQELKKHSGKGVVFCCNHLSYTDAPTMYIMFMRRLNYLVKPTLFKNKFWSSVFRGIGAIPVEKGKDFSLVKNCVSIIKNNGALMVFPEGIRALSTEDALNIRNGAAMIAIKGNVPIVPMVFKRAPRPFVPNAIKIGDAISVEQYQDKKLEKSDLNELSEEIHNAMQSLQENFSVKRKTKWWEDKESVIARGITFIDNKLLLIKRVKNGETYYVFPGGHIEKNEIARDAAMREIREETSVDTEVVRLIYKYEYKDDATGYGNGMQSFYLCNYRSGEPSKTDAEEYVQGASDTRGTYEPTLVDIDALAITPLRPASIKAQLIRDLKKYGPAIHKGAMFVD